MVKLNSKAGPASTGEVTSSAGSIKTPSFPDAISTALFAFTIPEPWAKTSSSISVAEDIRISLAFSEVGNSPWASL